MKMFCLVVASVCVLLASEGQSTIDDCTTGEQQNLLKNQLDLGQRYCDSNKHADLLKENNEDAGDEDLKKLQEFIHSIDCDTSKTC